MERAMTTRRKFIATAGVAIAGTLAAPAVARAQTVKWRMVTSWPKRLPGPGMSAERIAERVRMLSGGRIDISVFAAERLRDGGGSALLGQGKHLDFALAVLLLDAQHVTGADLARGLGALATGGDAAQFAGLGSLLARLEEARRPQPLVDAGAVHSWPPLPPISARSRFQ